MCQPDATPTGISVRTWTISRPAIDDALCWSSVRLSLPASSSAGMVLDDMSDPPESYALRRGDDRCGVAGAALAVDGQDPVGRAAQDQSGDINCLDVLGEVVEP